MFLHRILTIAFAFALAVSAASVQAGVLVDTEGPSVDVAAAVALSMSETDTPASPVIESHVGSSMNAVSSGQSSGPQFAMACVNELETAPVCMRFRTASLRLHLSHLPIELLKIPIAASSNPLF